MIISFVCWLLTRKSLTIQQRTRLIGAILESNNALPLRDVITWREDGQLMIRGDVVDADKAAKLREGAKRLYDNETRRVIMEHIASIAGTRGVVEGDTPEKLYFYRAALWWSWQEEEIIKGLAGTQE